MRQLISSLSSVWGRRLFWAAVCLYFGLGLGLLVLRYGVLPHIDHWRPQIARHLSEALGVEVALGPLHADWHGWDPGVRVQDLRLSDGTGHSLLRVPDVRARLNWLALLPGHQGLLRLEVEGLSLDVERLADGRLSFLGLIVSPDMDAPVVLPSWLQWVLTQPLIAFHDATLHWVDRARAAPDLSFEPIEAVWSYSTRRGASLHATALAPAAGGSRVELRARVADPVALLQDHWPKQVRVWVQASRVKPLAWRAWLPEVPAAWQQGVVDLQAWIEGSQAGPRVTVLGRLASLDWMGAGNANIRVPRAQLWAQGPWSRWLALARGKPEPEGVAFALRTSGTQLYLPHWFATVLEMGDLNARGRLLRPGLWQLTLDEAHWHNADVDLRAKGTWRAEGVAGTADLAGTMTRLRLPAVHRYLPLEVNASAREWLATGLQAGEVQDARWLLRGDLSRFPFGEQPQAGDFRITGGFRKTRIDLVPDKDQKKSWPQLELPEGQVDLHRMDLRLQAPGGTMAVTREKTITLSKLQARIPDMEHEPVLSVSGLTAAQGSAYLALIQNSPLGEMLNGVFDDAQATGDWQVPLALTVPLLHSLDTQVQGRVDLAGASLRFLPRAPEFQDLEGQIHFDENGIHVAQPLKGKVLGGWVQVRGDLGGASSRGLSFQGKASAQAIGHYVGVPGMKRVKGSLAYQALLSRQKQGYVFTLKSDTTGLDLDFPAPLSKPAGQERSLQVQWSDVDRHADTLEIRYGGSLRVNLVHPRSQRAGGPYFEQAAVGIGQAAALAPGLQVAIAYPLFDLDLWNRIVDEFAIVRRTQEHKGHQAKPTLWPDLSSLSVQADQLRLLGTRLDHAVLRVVKSPGEQWSMNVRSTQTTGTVKWQEQDGRVQGRMSARFARLSLGDDPRDNNALLPAAQVDEDAAFDDDLEIPGIVLQADEFKLYGRPLGALSLEGERDGVQHVWRLTHLRITQGRTRLQGTGTWRLRGPDRGLGLDASVQTDNLGAWMDHAGWPGVMAGGSGTLKGHFEWLDLPWTHRSADLQGELRIALDSGRLLKLGSHTAKLLEFLSLQSIARLSKLDRGLSGLLKEGVPFDQLRGEVSLKQGEAQVHDYKLIGSVGTILLEGSTNIVDETLNLQAVVVPNLDVSGAAIAAGIAVNPLVGLGAFITQWLLKTPLAKMMTAHYRITGTWDDPKVKDVPVAAAPPTKPAPVR